MSFEIALIALALLRTTPVPDGSRQMVLVVTPDVESIEGTLQRYQRASANVPWTAVGALVPIVLGPSGLGSALGLLPSPLVGLPFKEEGDGRSPAGVFELTTAFGFAEAPELRMPYVKLTSSSECVDDASSSHYNRIVSRDEVDEPDWNSSERMRAIPGYVWGVVVDHNPDSKPGEGSRIFLHVWSAPGKPTAGCTAMEHGAMEAMATWLDADASPVLVQLTRDLLDEFGESWQLPTPPSYSDSPN